MLQAGCEQVLIADAVEGVCAQDVQPLDDRLGSSCQGG